MKKIIASLTFIVSIALIGCGSKSGDPKAVLSSFFEAMGKKDMATAKKYATEGSKSMLDLMEMGMKADKDDKTAEEFSKENMEIGEPKIDGDKATVPVKNKKKDETVNFILKKEKGEWKVAFDKESMMEMSKDALKDKGMSETPDMPTDTSLNQLSTPTDSMP